MTRAARRPRAVAGAALVCAWLAATAAQAVTLWSDERVEGGAGVFFGPGNWMQVEPLFPVVIRHMGFISEADFVTPFKNNGERGPKTLGEAQLGLKDGKTSDGGLINHNVDTGVFVVAGTKMLPAVVRADGKFGGSQAAVSIRDGNVTMVMDLTLDLGIGPRGIVKMPFYGTTGTVVVPPSAQTQGGGQGVDRAGPIASGTTIAGRVGDFNGDGYIDGTLVAAGTMPPNSPIYPGQPWVMVRNFATDIAIDGRPFGAYRLNLDPSAERKR
ncbi:MAG: hypothetical protein LW847_11265 [Burkholderiales bacterium]|jgi:hypothetical protein|nr:hypothetical protein [Burkholderiales bacterium]